MVTQTERRAQTRRALLDAAAELFATQGIQGASVDAIAEAAGRTSGAVYDHFGGKEGLLFSLLEGWVDDVTEAVAAEIAATDGLEQQMAAVWRNVTRPVTGDGRWIDLEHELWRYASRHDDARERLALRYQKAWAGMDSEWSRPGASIGPVLMGLLLGLDMMRRIDPAAVTDQVAIEALTSLVRHHRKPERR